MELQGAILIVDDRADGRQAMEHLLQGEAYELIFAEDGHDALLQAADVTPDLILLDVMMPGMDGYEVCRRLRDDPLLREVPIIMVTGLDDHDARLKGIEAGADDFVSKPPDDPAALQARIRTIIRLGRFRRLFSERAKFEWLVEQSADGLLIVNMQDRLLYANPRARLYLGLPEDSRELPDQPFLELARQAYHCEPRELWQSWPALPAGHPPSPRYLIRVESPTASPFWLQIDLLSLRLEPEGGWLVRLRDVSDRMARERDIWKFHAAISHKLRTPVSSTINSLELLARHAEKMSGSEITELSQKALENVQRLHAQIEDIFQYIGAASYALPGSGFHLAQLVPLAESFAESLDIDTVEITLPEELRHTRVLISPQAMELVLREILENAKKFHPTRSPAIEISAYLASREEVALRIADDGLALSPEQLAQVWTPYFQSERYFSGEVSGMGLGLPLVASVLWEAGGTSRIYNRENGPGVVVELLLPTRRVPPPLSF